MTITSASLTATSPILDDEDETTSQCVVTVHSCSRLGRTANPPSRWSTDWFRPRRRR
jgi:hypothetical protein